MRHACASLFWRSCKDGKLSSRAPLSGTCLLRRYAHYFAMQVAAMIEQKHNRLHVDHNLHSGASSVFIAAMCQSECRQLCHLVVTLSYISQKLQLLILTMLICPCVSFVDCAANGCVSMQLHSFASLLLCCRWPCWYAVTFYPQL